MTPEMRTRSPAFSDSTSASENGVRTSLISSEGGCAPLPEPPPFDGAGEAGARSRSLTASLPCRGGGRSWFPRGWDSPPLPPCPPPQIRPPSLAPAPPSLGRGGASRRAPGLPASLPCGGGRGIRFPRRGAAPPFRTSPLRWRRQRRRSDGGADRAAQPSSQRHFLVAVGVAFDGDGGGEGGEGTGVGGDVGAEGRGVAAGAPPPGAPPVGPGQPAP